MSSIPKAPCCECRHSSKMRLENGLEELARLQNRLCSTCLRWRSAFVAMHTFLWCSRTCSCSVALLMVTWMGDRPGRGISMVLLCNKPTCVGRTLCRTNESVVAFAWRCGTRQHDLQTGTCLVPAEGQGALAARHRPLPICMQPHLPPPSLPAVSEVVPALLWLRPALQHRPLPQGATTEPPAAAAHSCMLSSSSKAILQRWLVARDRVVALCGGG